MASSASSPETTSREPSGKTPNVRAIMAGIRKTLRETPRGAAAGERDLAADLRQRMTRPLSGRRFSGAFAEGVRSGDPSRWNLRAKPQAHPPADTRVARVVRAVFGPLVRRAIDSGALHATTVRQSEINEYYRRLLWAVNRDLLATRAELTLLKRELVRLGIHTEPPARGDGAKAGTPRRPPRRGGRGRRPRRPDRRADRRPKRS